MFSSILNSIKDFSTSDPSEIEDVGSNDVDPTNGSVFTLSNKNTYRFPDELLIEILIQFDPKTLLSCRRVCHKWKSIIDQDVFKQKILRQYLPSLKSVDADVFRTKYSWQVCCDILMRISFNRNFLVNPCGYDDLKGWELLSNGGDGWKTESPPCGTQDALPEDSQFDRIMQEFFVRPNQKLSKSDKKKLESASCFATSHGRCEKVQYVCLKSKGLTDEIMDHVKPILVYGAWISRRWDCGGHYKLNVQLLGEDREKVLATKTHVEILLEDKKNWRRVENKFENYPSGVRYVRYEDMAVDNQFWRGHYGPKISRCCLWAVPPGTTFEIDMKNNVPVWTETRPYPEMGLPVIEVDNYNLVEAWDGVEQFEHENGQSEEEQN